MDMNSKKDSMHQYFFCAFNDICNACINNIGNGLFSDFLPRMLFLQQSIEKVSKGVVVSLTKRIKIKDHNIYNTLKHCNNEKIIKGCNEISKDFFIKNHLYEECFPFEDKITVDSFNSIFLIEFQNILEQSFFQARYLDGEWLHATSSAYYYNIDIVISCLKLFEYIYSYTNPEIKPEWLDGFSMKSIKDYCRNSQGDAGKNIRAGYLVECLKNNNIDEYIYNVFEPEFYFYSFFLHKRDIKFPKKWEKFMDS
mgnify:CR=1 FL=1|tara:strand:+ start:2134 stop:2892 length:759 start_codon:yes stop_codon:yes gene_type:complete